MNLRVAPGVRSWQLFGLVVGRSAAALRAGRMIPIVIAATAGQMLAKSLLYLSGLGLLRLPGPGRA